MTAKERLLQELEQVPDLLIEEVIDFLLFLKTRHAEAIADKEAALEDDFSAESFRTSWQQATAGQTLPLSQLWEGVDVD